MTNPPVRIEPVTTDRLPDVAALFGTNKTTAGCYCLWFLVPVKQCHAGWGEANQRAFEATAATEPEPMGLLAYRDDEAVGWAAAGPLARYARVLTTPTMAGYDHGDAESVWLVPCFFVRRDARRTGVTRSLLEAAVELANQHGARAVEGFPLAGDRRRPASDAYVGVETVFADCGFTVVSRASGARVVMRRDLTPRRSKRPAPR